MKDVAICFTEVWRKFRRGERHDSLRDLVPTAMRRLVGRTRPEPLKATEFWALQDVSFEVPQGAALGVIGANGAGKSTTLKLLSGILTPTRGTVAIRGRLSSLIEVGAGFHPDLTGRENVFLNGTILGMSRREIAQKFDQIVEFAGLAEFIDTPVKRYSSGMYARLGFAVAAHVDPDILLVDEVLSVGDMPFQEKCLERMKEVARRGTTIVFVSHNLQSVQLVCSHTLLLDRGKVAMVGTTAQVISHYVSGMKGAGPPGRGIENIVLCDQSGVAKTIFEAGEPAELRFEVHCDGSLDGCVLGFLLHRATDGLAVCDYNLPIPHGDGTAACGVLRGAVGFQVNLLRGAYIVSLHVFDPATSSFLARAERVSHFFVEEMESWQGVAHVAPEVRVEAWAR